MEKKGKKEDGGPPIRKRERFRLLINMIGRKEDQDSTEVWEEKSRSTAPKEAEGTASNASEEATAEKVTEEKSQNAENHSEADQTKAEEVPLLPPPLNSYQLKMNLAAKQMTNCYEDDSNEDPKQIEARRALRINTMRLINTIFSVTSNISVRVAIRKCMIDLGISDKISVTFCPLEDKDDIRLILFFTVGWKSHTTYAERMAGGIDAYLSSHCFASDVFL